MKQLIDYPLHSMEWALHFLITNKEICKIMAKGHTPERMHWINIKNQPESVETLNTIEEEAKALFTKNGLTIASTGIESYGLEIGLELPENLTDEEYDRLETETLIAWKFICSKHKVLPIEMHSEEHKEISFD